MFGDDLFSLYNSVALRERQQAAKGTCPSARTCDDSDDLAGWFKSLGVAAGVVARSKASD